MDTAHLPFFIQFGKFRVYLASRAEDIEGAQKLRYDVFYKEMGANESASLARGRDEDSFDAFVEHLVVQDKDKNKIVGTYRLLRREGARKHGSFYTQGEFDVTSLLAMPGEILEVSRSCVDRAYRTQSVMGLLWRGLAEYILHYDVQYLFGCGSFHGTDPAQVAHGLSYLYHHHLLPESYRTRTLPQYFKPLVHMPKEAVDTKKALADIPPLLRGYTRIGGGVGDGIFIDEEFNTIDVCVVVDSNCLKPKFAQHFNAHSEQTSRFPLNAS
ncbi:GNAT family N-acetyltransferase [bacterium NHP-B]|nr:GNAT family N-acetyltransferase [bacterium NHP-B]